MFFSFVLICIHYICKLASCLSSPVSGVESGERVSPTTQSVISCAMRNYRLLIFTFSEEM